MIGASKDDVLLVVASMSVLLASSQAAADWQYTRWGMSFDEAVQASKATQQHPTHRSPAKKSTETSIAGLVADYDADPFVFETVFMFTRNTNRLDRVVLELKNPKRGNQLRRDLEGIYGEPFSHSGDGTLQITKWRENNNKNWIALVQIGSDLYSVEYWPLVESSSGKL